MDIVQKVASYINLTSLSNEINSIANSYGKILDKFLGDSKEEILEIAEDQLELAGDNIYYIPTKPVTLNINKYIGKNETYPIEIEVHLFLIPGSHSASYDSEEGTVNIFTGIDSLSKGIKLNTAQLLFHELTHVAQFETANDIKNYKSVKKHSLIDYASQRLEFEAFKAELLNLIQNNYSSIVKNIEDKNLPKTLPNIIRCIESNSVVNSGVLKLFKDNDLKLYGNIVSDIVKLVHKLDSDF
jgi:hypothetical protein